MPRYFFHLRDGGDVLLDPEGRKLHGLDDVARQALFEARSLISQEALQGLIDLTQRIEVEDERRNLVHRLAFTEAVDIVKP